MSSSKDLVRGLVILLIPILVGCKSYKKQLEELPDTFQRGTINVSADESFRPVIDELVQVYESRFPETKINVQYKPEAECLKDFATDSIRMIIATRGYSERERNFMIDSLRVGPEKLTVARDAVAVIVNPDSPDSLFSMEEIKEILKGGFKKNLIPVFDGVNATSTVRFIIDSVLRNDTLTPKAMAAKTSEGVIDFVAKNRQAIGFIGVSWIGNKEDTAQLSFLKKVKIAHLESTDKADTYILPVQNNIYLHRYPMVRDLVYILKEKHAGLGKAFANFMSGEIGQLIFKRAYLDPTVRNFILRPAQLNE
ncbi:MAG TPA: substrate-binding domain-containing protein [Chitinophagaceae bacterium]